MQQQKTQCNQKKKKKKEYCIQPLKKKKHGWPWFGSRESGYHLDGPLAHEAAVKAATDVIWSSQGSDGEKHAQDCWQSSVPQRWLVEGYSPFFVSRSLSTGMAHILVISFIRERQGASKRGVSRTEVTALKPNHGCDTPQYFGHRLLIRNWAVQST